MNDQLANGSLGELIKQMPPTLRKRLDDDIALFDKQLLKEQQEGNPKEPSLYNQLRWARKVKPRPRLGRLSMDLGRLLKKYFPLTDDMVHANQLPSQSDCTYFWAREIKHLEKESNQASVIA